MQTQSVAQYNYIRDVNSQDELDCASSARTQVDAQSDNEEEGAAALPLDLQS